MKGQVVQVNLSAGGVPKRAVEEAVLTPLGLEGDAFAHPNIHGGPRQALLLMAMETIAKLIEQNYPVYPGALGENITTEGIDPGCMRPGQRYRIGDALIELTKIRVPCSTLDVYGKGIQQQLYDLSVKRGDTGSPLYGRSGFYAAVIQPGRIRAGAVIELLEEFA